MKTLFPAILVAAGFLAGCSTPPPQRDPSTFFQIVAEEIVTVGSGTNYAAILIRPAKDKRWDRNYAANARVVSAEGLAPESMTFDKAAFVVKDNHTRLNVPIATSVPGAFKVEIALNFSVCDNLGCETFENVPVTIPFVVKATDAVPQPPEPKDNADLSLDAIRNPEPPHIPEMMKAAPNSPELMNGAPVPQPPMPQAPGPDQNAVK